MKVNSSDTLIRQELLSKILGNKEVENNSTKNSNSALKQADEKINIGLSQYINNNISKETIALERQEKVAKLKELYEKKIAISYIVHPKNLLVDGEIIKIPPFLTIDCFQH